MKVLLLLINLWEILSYEVLIAINCGSYTHTTIPTKFFNYTVDNFYEGLASAMQTKSSVPQSISHQTDRQLVKTHRTTSQGYTNFSYRPIFYENGYYIAIITMIETEFRNKGERIFHIKLGDQVIHTVDIVAEVGFGKILHKWIQFDIREDVAFINGTLPALNAFNFKSRQIRIVFESAKNKPKIEAIVFLKGGDSHTYLKQFLQYEQEKSVKTKQYIAQKYRKQPKLSYRPLLASDLVAPPQTQFQKFYKKFITIRSVGSIICGIFAVHFEKIIALVVSMYHSLIQKIKNLNSRLGIKKKKL